MVDIMEFKKRRRRRWGQKMNLYFTYESRDALRSFSLFLTVKTISKLCSQRDDAEDKNELIFYLRISRYSKVI